MALDRIVIPVDQLKKIQSNIEFNGRILKFYDLMISEKPDFIGFTDSLIFKKARMETCNKIWISDFYEVQKIKDFQRTSLCEDKFCNNCKKVKQARRMATFEPKIREHQGSLFLLTLTVPNVCGGDLTSTIKKMQKAFARLIMYFKGNTKARGIDFSQFKYQGALRSLEVTFHDDQYHPHYHAVMVMDPRIDLSKNQNVFSFDRFSENVRNFTNQEILIQKVWKMLYLGETVNFENLENNETGFSCTLDKLQKGDYLEVFKYMTKGTDQNGTPLTYEQFKTLYKALDAVRQIQGYGCLFRLSDDDLIEADKVDEIYNGIITAMQESEMPLRSYDTPKALASETVTVISRKKIAKFLREINEHPQYNENGMGCQKGGAENV